MTDVRKVVFILRLMQCSVFGALLGISLALPLSGAAAAPLGPAQAPVNRETVASEQELVRRSDLILYGRIGEQTEHHPTGRREGTYKVVHYVQTIRVKNTWKGRAPGPVRLLTSGLEPLPDAGNPLNRVYTGPLEAGDYVWFLRRVPGTGYYTLTGLWQGLFPVFEGKSVSLLHNGGFSSFDQLTLRSFEAKVKAMSASV